MVERIVLCSCTIKQTGIRVQQIRREKDNNPDEIDNTKNQICSILALLQYETGIRRFYIIWAASLVTGVCSMIPQIFIPIASQFSRPENKGCNVGVVIAGLLTGICPSAPTGRCTSRTQRIPRFHTLVYRYFIQNLSYLCSR